MTRARAGLLASATVVLLACLASCSGSSTARPDSTPGPATSAQTPSPATSRTGADDATTRTGATDATTQTTQARSDDTRSDDTRSDDTRSDDTGSDDARSDDTGDSAPSASDREASDQTYRQPVPAPEQAEGDVRSSDPVEVAAGTGPTSAVVCPGPTTEVRDADSLTEALERAGPGSVIRLADGVYGGNFAATTAGTAEQPIWLCGGPGAVLDGGSVKSGYTLYLKGASHWRLVGFAVRGGQKGVMVDAATDVVIQGLTVSAVGDEAVHLRSGTTYSLVRDNDISRTGLRREKYGEGVYVGSASSNWCTYSACEPDRTNNNAVVDNVIHSTSSEAIDVKEGTQNGLIRGNTVSGADGLTAADSWVDIKGNGWTIQDNHGSDSPVDGFQVHSVVDGWGTDNVFEDNDAEVNGSGFGVHVTPVLGNIVSCDNTATGAASGLTNTECG